MRDRETESERGRQRERGKANQQSFHVSSCWQLYIMGKSSVKCINSESAERPGSLTIKEDVEERVKRSRSIKDYVLVGQCRT